MLTSKKFFFNIVILLCKWSLCSMVDTFMCNCGIGLPTKREHCPHVLSEFKDIIPNSHFLKHWLKEKMFGIH
jgi:hypothetical protein